MSKASKSPINPGIIAALELPPTSPRHVIADIGLSVTDLLLRKNADYGNSALEPPILLPEFNARAGILLRMSDKIARLRTIKTEDGRPAIAETAEDTMRDLAGYAILWLASRKLEQRSAKPSKLNEPPEGDGGMGERP